MDADATDGLLDELLSLLDDEPSEQQCEPLTQQPQTHKKSRKAQAATTAPLRGKRQLEQLQREAELLSQQLEGLRLLKNVTASETQARAMTEKYKRRRAEQECEQLRLAVYTHAQFLRGLRSLFSLSMHLNVADLNLCHCFHSYTRLPGDKSTRLSEYAALAQETRLRVAADMLWRETHSSCSTVGLLASASVPRVECEMLKHPNGFGITTMSVFAVDAKDLGSVLRAACVAVRDIFMNGPSYRCVTVKRTNIEDPETTSSEQPRLLYQSMCTTKKSYDCDDQVAVESRLVTLCRESNDEAIVLWDFVDDDELNPTLETTDITRDWVGACLIRREVCNDGVVRPVCRSLYTRFYRFHGRADRAVLRRYAAFSEQARVTNALMFRRLLVEEVAKEEALYAYARGEVSV